MYKLEIAYVQSTIKIKNNDSIDFTENAEVIITYWE